MVKLYFKKLLFGGIYFGIFNAFFFIFSPMLVSVMGFFKDNVFLRMIVLLAPSSCVIALISFYNRISKEKRRREYLAQLREGKTDMRKYLRSLPDIRAEALVFVTFIVLFMFALVSSVIKSEPIPAAIFAALFMGLVFFSVFFAINLLLWVLVVRKWEKD